LAELSSVAENRVRRGFKQVELPDDVPARELEARLKTAIDETLDGEWAFTLESVGFVQHDEPTNTVFFDVVFVAVPGSGPTDDTSPRNNPYYKPGRFDTP
jgi:hypothetical protein